MTKKEWILLLCLVAFDLITKLSANYYLPFEEKVPVIGDTVGLYLTYNQGATGGQAGYLMEDDSNMNMTVILSCVNALLLLSYILFIRKKELKTIYKILIGVGIYIGLSILIQFARWSFTEVLISSWTASVVGKLTGLAIYGSLFFLSQDRLIRLFSLIILSCGIGNLLSHFYLPYRVIDFISIKGTYELFRIGVFNVADLAYDIGTIGLIIAIVGFTYRKIRANKSKPIEVMSKS